MPFKAGLGLLCGLFGLTRQAWYAHWRHQEDQRLAEAEILAVVARLRRDGRFGARMLLRMAGPELEAMGLSIGRDRFIELLRDNGLLLRPRRRALRTTDSAHHLQKWPYLLAGQDAAMPEQVWVADITYIRTEKGFLYLFLVTDACSRKVMGFHLSHTLEARGALAALRMALRRRAYPGRPLVHHSDRGAQYCCQAYVDLLQANGVAISMTEGGSPHQNTIAERINRTFKEQLHMDRVFDGYHAAMTRLVRAVEVYNTMRPHGSCGGLTPEQAHMAQGPLKREWRVRKKNAGQQGDTAEALAGLHTSWQV
jgi:putative transposase